jgi:UDP:flavonoid glycosyltransferase YjiC (YdhE family)
MKLLLFPSDLGGGFGHVSRCLALAEEARGQGHRSVFVLNSPKYLTAVRHRFPARLCREQRPLAALAHWLRPHRDRPNPPLFSEFSGLDYQVPRDGLLSRERVQRRLDQYLRVANEEKPDLLVGDTNLLVRMLAARTALPVVQLVRCASHPDSARLIWWKEVPQELVPPRTPDLFNPLLEPLNLPPIERAEDLLRGDLYLVPSLPEIEPLPEADNTAHLGALNDDRREEQAPAWLEGLPENQPLVYATLGGGAGMVGNREIIRRLVAACSGQPFQVVLATGGTIRGNDLPALPRNIRLLSWAPGQLLIRRADLVIFHGGYGTMMETVAAGTPTLAIPFQSEQEGNARRLEQLGCGRLILPSRSEPITLTAHWPFGSYTWRVRAHCDLTVEELRDGICAVLEDGAAAGRARELRQKILRRPGAEIAVERIERLMKR